MDTISPWIVTQLERKKYTSLLPIQKILIPNITRVLRSGFQVDFMLSAPTGSGKTLCFLVPLIEMVALEKKRRFGSTQLNALILVPSKPLGNQITHLIRSLTRGTEIQVADVTGTAEGDALVRVVQLGACSSTDKTKCVNHYFSKVDIMVSTPQKVMKHLWTTTGFSLKDLKILVVDEADHILHGSFTTLLNSIVSTCEEQRREQEDYNSLRTLCGSPLQELLQQAAFKEGDVKRPTVERLTVPVSRTPLCKILCSATMSTHIAKITDIRLQNCKYYSLSSDGLERAEGDDPFLTSNNVKSTTTDALNVYQTKFSMPPNLNEHIIIVQDRFRHAVLLKLIYAICNIDISDVLGDKEATKLPIENVKKKDCEKDTKLNKEVFTDINHEVSTEEGKDTVQFKRMCSSILIFCETTASAQIIGKYIRSAGCRTLEFTSYVSEASRKQALLSMQRGMDMLQYSALDQGQDDTPQKSHDGAPTPFVVVTTDALVRGIDLPGVNHVIMYDPPRNLPQYIHRVGRTARALKTGDAYVLLSRLGPSGGLKDGQVAAFKRQIDSHVVRAIPLTFDEKEKYYITEEFAALATALLQGPVVSDSVYSRSRDLLGMKRARSDNPTGVCNGGKTKIETKKKFGHKTSK